jgi:hypothetical protein
MKPSRLLYNVLLVALFPSIVAMLFYSITSFNQTSDPIYTNTTEATEIPEPINVLIEVTKKDEKVAISSATLLTGKNIPLIVDVDPGFYIDQIAEEKNINSTPLDFSQYDSNQESLDYQTIALIIQYYPGAELQIRDTLSGESYLLDKHIVTQALSAPPPAPIEFEIETVDIDDSQSPVLGYSDTLRDGYLDIVFISSNFSSQQKFNDYVTAYTRHLLEYDPFKQYKQKIRVKKIFTKADMKCSYKKYASTNQQNIYCNTTAAYQLLSQTSWDTGVVLDDSGTWGASTSYSQIINLGMVAPNVLYLDDLIHEMGHAVGKLSDEYTYSNSTGSENVENLGPNCDMAGCAKWSTIAGTQCIPGCTYVNAYRSSQNSLMNMAGTFNTVSRNALISSLETYTTLPDAPPLPRIVSACTTERINGYFINVPFIDITWNQNDVIQMIEVTKDKNVTNMLKSSTLNNPSVISRKIKQNNVFLDEYTLSAPDSFTNLQNQPVNVLDDDTTYYVRFFDGNKASDYATVKTKNCSESMDLNADGAINMADFERMKNMFGKTGASGFDRADIDKTGLVDIYDYNFYIQRLEYYLTKT